MMKIMYQTIPTHIPQTHATQTPNRNPSAAAQKPPTLAVHGAPNPRPPTHGTRIPWGRIQKHRYLQVLIMVLNERSICFSFSSKTKDESPPPFMCRFLPPSKSLSVSLSLPASAPPSEPVAPRPNHPRTPSEPPRIPPEPRQHSVRIPPRPRPDSPRSRPNPARIPSGPRPDSARTPAGPARIPPGFRSDSAGTSAQTPVRISARTPARTPPGSRPDFVRILFGFCSDFLPSFQGIGMGARNCCSDFCSDFVRISFGFFFGIRFILFALVQNPESSRKNPNNSIEILTFLDGS